MYPKYYGNGAYCYSNSTAMLLSSIEEDISPSIIEVLGGVGLGAYALDKGNMVFLSNYSGFPDRSISRALESLGFNFEEKNWESEEYYPLEELRELIKQGPVLLGPLDMGYLKYDPSSNNHFGVDHFVVAHDFDDKRVCVHDPAEFPNVWITNENLNNAWKAENIGYRQGHYRYWAKPKRANNPTNKELFQKAIKTFIEIYENGETCSKSKNKLIDVEAIRFLSNNIKNKVLTTSEIDLLTGFVLPVSAKRSNDFYSFLREYDKKLAELKIEQSKMLGKIHTAIMDKSFPEAVTYLDKYAELEGEFKNTVLDYKNSN